MEEPRYDELGNMIDPFSYYSVLVKAVPKSADASALDQNLDQVQVTIVLSIFDSFKNIYPPLGVYSDEA